MGRGGDGKFGGYREMRVDGAQMNGVGMLRGALGGWRVEMERWEGE